MEPQYRPTEGLERKNNEALETWSNIKGALIGVAATKFKDYVGQFVPGFNEQYQATEAKRRSGQPALASPAAGPRN
jgi:hypothetical protein